MGTVLLINGDGPYLKGDSLLFLKRDNRPPFLQHPRSTCKEGSVNEIDNLQTSITTQQQVVTYYPPSEAQVLLEFSDKGLFRRRYLELYDNFGLNEIPH